MKHTSLVLIFIGMLVFGGFIFPHAAHADITTNLVSWWKFDEGSGTSASDSTGHGHTATMTGTIGWTSSAKFGTYAASFPGNGGDIMSISSLTTGTTFTYAAWIYPTVDSTGVYQNLFTQGGTAGIWLNGKKINFFYGTDHRSSTDITLNTWHHIAVVNNAGSVTFYLDGVADGTAASGPSFDADSMGCDNPSGSECYAGRLDDARLYSRALSAGDIGQLYKYGGAVPWKVAISPNSLALGTGLVGWWTLDGKDLVSNVMDRSGSGYTGYLKSFTSTSSAVTIGKIGQALKFNGTNYITTQAQNAIKGQPAATLAFWAKPNSAGQLGVALIDTHVASNQVILDYEISANTDSVIRCTTISGASCNVDGSTNPWQTNANWHHIVVTYDGTPRLYVDGVLNSSGSATGENLQTGGDEQYFNIGQTWQGVMDDVRMYNRALSAAEVKQLYGFGGSRENIASAGPANGSGLAGWWTFDGKDTPWTSSTAATTKDRSGNGNDGTLNSMNRSTAPKVGKIGQALSFDGSSSYVSVSQSSSLNDLGPLTYSVWVYATSLNTAPRILSKGDRKYIRLNKLTFNGDINFTVAYDTTDLSVTTNEDLPLNAWTHLVITWDGTSSASGVHIYINAIEATYAEQINGSSAPDSESAYGMNIGDAYYGSSSTKWTGSIDDVRIYNRALSQADVIQLFKLGAPKNTTQPIAPCTPSYANHGGTGDRRPGLGLANIYVTSSGGGITAMQGGGGSADSAWVDGDNTSAGHGFFGTVSLDGTQWLEFDFSSGNSVLITEAKYYQQTSDVQGTWKWQGSNDNSTWTDIGGSFTLGGTPTETITTLSGNMKKYRYYRINGLSGATTPNPWLYEMEFKICGLP